MSIGIQNICFFFLIVGRHFGIGFVSLFLRSSSPLPRKFPFCYHACYQTVCQIISTQVARRYRSCCMLQPHNLLGSHLKCYMVFSTQFARVSVHRLQAAATEVAGSQLVPDLNVSQESSCPVTAGPRGPSFCVGTVGPIDHSPYTVPTVYRDPGPPRSSLLQGGLKETDWRHRTAGKWVGYRSTDPQVTLQNDHNR